MDATASSAVAAREIPTGPTVSELLQEFYSETGIVPPTSEEIANLSPWTEKEAVAFEQTINEAFERIDEVRGSL